MSLEGCISYSQKACGVLNEQFSESGVKTPFCAVTKMEKCASTQIWVRHQCEKCVVQQFLYDLTRGAGRYKCLNLHQRLFKNITDSQGQTSKQEPLFDLDLRQSRIEVTQCSGIFFVFPSCYEGELGNRIVILLDLLDYGVVLEVPNVCARLSSLHILHSPHTFPFCFCFCLDVTDTVSIDRCSVTRIWSRCLYAASC